MNVDQLKERSVVYLAIYLATRSPDAQQNAQQEFELAKETLEVDAYFNLGFEYAVHIRSKEQGIGGIYTVPYIVYITPQCKLSTIEFPAHHSIKLEVSELQKQIKQVANRKIRKHFLHNLR